MNIVVLRGQKNINIFVQDIFHHYFEFLYTFCGPVVKKDPFGMVISCFVLRPELIRAAELGQEYKH